MEKLFHATDWVFDLDNTLYPPESDLFAQIQVKMNTYVANFLGLPLDKAREVQKKYYVEHGTTLNGLMLHHNIDPHDYLHQVHDIDYSFLENNSELRANIAALPGRKIVFTNGSKQHAESAIKALGLENVFHDLVDIVATDFIPKPQKQAFDALIKAHNIDPNTSVMVEDLSKNLQTAHDMGFATVLVWSDKIWHDEPKGHLPAGPSDLGQAHIHHATNNLSEFLKVVVKSGKLED